MSRVLLTGATGMVGSHLAHELIGRGRSLVLLARDREEMTATQRVERLFSHLDQCADPSYRARGTYEVVAGDITRPGCGIDPDEVARLRSEVSEVWHCAVLSSFDERRREDIEQVNGVGSMHLLELAEALEVERCHFVSTAYVAGKRRGTAYEEPCTGGSFRNSYERTKCEMESHLMEKAPAIGIAPTIYRLAIVVGDSRTAETTSFNGYYNLARAFATIRKKVVEQTGPSEVVQIPIRIPCASDTTVNLVTIDFVTRVMCEIGEHPDGAGRIVHVTNPDPITGRELWSNSLDHLGIAGYTFVESVDEIIKEPVNDGVWGEIEKRMLHWVRIYLEYMQGEPVFDTTNARALSRDFSHAPMTRDFVGRLLDYALEAGWRADY